MHIHKDQKYGDEDLILHAVQVVKIIEAVAEDDENLMTAAYMHDALKRTNTTHDNIAKSFNEDVANLIYEATHCNDPYYSGPKTRRGQLLLQAAGLSSLASSIEGERDRNRGCIAEGVICQI